MLWAVPEAPLKASFCITNQLLDISVLEQVQNLLKDRVSVEVVERLLLGLVGLVSKLVVVVLYVGFELLALKLHGIFEVGLELFFFDFEVLGVKRLH